MASSSLGEILGANVGTSHTLAAGCARVCNAIAPDQQVTLCH